MEQTLGGSGDSPSARGAAEKRRILIASDHSIIRHGLKLMLSAATSHLVVGDDRPLAEVRDMIALHRPDVVIADVSTGTLGVGALAAAFGGDASSVKLLLLCQPGTVPGTGELAAFRGAAGVSASDDAVQLLNALRSLLLAQPASTPVPGDAPAILAVARETSVAPAESVHVTPREREVIELITQGLCSKRIARALNISVTTVRTHRQRLMSKLGLRNSVEVAQFAARTFGGGVLARPMRSAARID